MKLIGAAIHKHDGSYHHGGGDARFEAERFSTIRELFVRRPVVLARL